MSIRIGIALSQDHVRAVAVRDEEILWALEREVTDSASPASAISGLLASMALPRWPRPRVNVAFGPTFAQVKLLRGLPPLRDPRAIARLVQESAGRLFVRNGVPLVTTGVRILEPGSVWAAALDQRTVTAVEAACHALRLRLRAVVPAAVVLHRALVGERIVWHEGRLQLEVILTAGNLGSIRRYLGEPPAGEAQALEPVEPLARLGEQATRFAAAYGAAMLPPGEPLALRSGGTVDSGVPRWRLAAAAAVCASAVTIALITPTVAALHAAAEARERLESLGEERRSAIEKEKELQRATAALSEIGQQDAARISTVFLLADLARALPEGSAMVTFRIDSVEGHLVALAPRAIAVLSPLEGIPGIVGPEIVGPVTRELIGGRDLERVTLHFRLDAVRRRPRPTDLQGAQR